MFEPTIAIEAALIGATAEEAAADEFMQPNDSDQTLFVRLIKAGRSLNTLTNYDYPADALEQATPLFGGVHVYENHADPEQLRRNHGVRRVQEKVGRIKLPRWNAAAQAVEARMQIFSEALYRQYKLGGDAYGVSMEADLMADPNTRAVPRRVGSITKVKAVAIVDLAGAGGTIGAAAEAAYEAAEAARKEGEMPDCITAEQMQAMMETVMAKGMAMSKSKAMEDAAQDTTDWQAEAEAAKARLARFEALEAARRVGSELNATAKRPLGGYTLATACEAALNDCADLQPETIKAAVTARFNALAADQAAPSNPVRGMGAATASEAQSPQQPTPPQARSDYQMVKQDIWHINTPATQPQNGGVLNGR